MAGVDGFCIDCTVKLKKIFRVGSDIWGTFAARHDVSYIYMSQKDLPGLASDPELKITVQLAVYEYVTQELQIIFSRQ